MTPPPVPGQASEEAVKAAAIAAIDPQQVYIALAVEHWEATIGRMARDPRNMTTVRRALAAAHDPALGLDRSVCLRDVVELLKEQRANASGLGRVLWSAAAARVVEEFSSTASPSREGGNRQLDGDR